MRRLRVVLLASLLTALPAVCPEAIAESQADTCLTQMPGDLNSDGAIDSLDLGAFQQFWSTGNPVPSQLSNADLNGDCFISQGDIDLLEDYLAGGSAPVACTCLAPQRCECVWGDANGDRQRSISDIVKQIRYIFAGGTLPAPFCNSDLNCDCYVTVSDVVLNILFIFGGGQINTDCDGCDEWLDHCAH